MRRRGLGGGHGYIEATVDALLQLADPWAYVVVALLVAGEAALLIGLVLPGETAVFLGGVLAFEQRVELWLMLVVAYAAAVVGDSIGYEIGHRLGPRLMRGRLGQRIGPERWDRAASFLRRYGGRAVFLGRWVGVLRALVPSLAGAAGIPYRVFLAFNVLGGVTWATTFVLLGYAAGRSWRAVDHALGRASVVVIVLVVAVAAIVLAARWVASHRDEVAARREALLGWGPVAALRRRLSPLGAFLQRRLDPHERFGLYVTIGLAIAVGGLWAFGAVVQDVIAHDELALVDRPVTAWLVQHRDPQVTTAIELLSVIGRWWFVFGGATAAVLALAATRRASLAMFVAMSVCGAGVLLWISEALVTRPQTGGGAAARGTFPSSGTLAATVLCAALAHVLARGRRWTTGVWLWVVAAVVALLVGFGRLYLGPDRLTDVLGAYALGGFWVAVSAVATSLWARPDAAVPGPHREAEPTRVS